MRTGKLFLAQKIEVGVTAGTRKNDGGKVPGEIVGIVIVIRRNQRKRERKLQRDLGRSDDLTDSPRLTVNRNFTTGSNCIQERLAISGKSCIGCYYSGKQ